MSTDKPFRDCHMCQHRERDVDFTFSCGNPDYIEDEDIVEWEDAVMDSDILMVSPGLPLPGCSILSHIGPCPGFTVSEKRWSERLALRQRTDDRIAERWVHGAEIVGACPYEGSEGATEDWELIDCPKCCYGPAQPRDSANGT